MGLTQPYLPPLSLLPKPFLDGKKRKDNGPAPFSHLAVPWSLSCPPSPGPRPGGPLPAHPLLPQPSCRGPARDQPSICVPTAELFENTDAVFLISASQGQAQGLAGSSLLNGKLEASQEPSFPFLAGLVPSRAQPQRAGAAGCSLGRDRFCKGFSGGSPLSFLLNTCASSSRNGILIPVKHLIAPPSPCGLCGTGPTHNPEMRPNLDPSESLCSWDSQWAWDQHVTPHQTS